MRKRSGFKLFAGPAILFLLLGFLFSCDWGPQLNSKNQVENNTTLPIIPSYEGLEPGDFYAMNMENGVSYTVNAVLLAENDSCRVYGERSAGVSTEMGESIALEIENQIYPAVTGVFGNFQETLRDRGFGSYDKLTLLLMDIKDGYNPWSNSYTAGYFYPQDMYSREKVPNSNETAIIYLDTNPGEPGGKDFFTTIAHELQHLINYSVRIKQQGGGQELTSSQHTWIDEGLASAAEYLYGLKPIKSKIDYFNEDKGNAFSKGDTFFTWDNKYEDYCTVYLFFQWLRIQAGGVEIYKDIINSEHLDYRAVTEAAFKYKIIGQSDDWEYLLGRWLLANYVNAGEGPMGYGGEIKIEIRTTAGSRISLTQGAGVFSYLGGKAGFTPGNSGPNIRYLGVTQAGELIAASGGVFPSGKIGRILTFNANRDISKPSALETGYLTNEVEPWSRAVEETRSAQGPYPVDIPPAFFLE
jgi:hypothetical protein